jgi:hypothetical protein
VSHMEVLRDNCPTLAESLQHYCVQRAAKATPTPSAASRLKAGESKPRSSSALNFSTHGKRGVGAEKCSWHWRDPVAKSFFHRIFESKFAHSRPLRLGANFKLVVHVLGDGGTQLRRPQMATSRTQLTHEELSRELLPDANCVMPNANGGGPQQCSLWRFGHR